MDRLGIDHHHYHYPHQLHSPGHVETQQFPPQSRRKRKAPENNERLSKRMSLLNLEHCSRKPDIQPANHISTPSKPKHKPTVGDSQMQLDDSKHKVYIYNIEDELSSDNESDAERPIFLPDIEKYLRLNRIQPRLLDPYPDPASGHAGKELVLYSEPSSLSVPEELDSVRRAIIEARQRAREKQRLELGPKRELEREQACSVAHAPVPPTMMSSSASPPLGDVRMNADEDPDAMELD